MRGGLQLSWHILMTKQLVAVDCSRDFEAFPSL